MKKLLFILMLCLMAFAFSSCDSQKEQKTQSINWNLSVSAVGEGYLAVNYPTGQLTLEGTAKATAVTTNDTTYNYLLSNGCPEYKTVLQNPEQFTPEEINLANDIKSAFTIDSMNGRWQVDITGYAKYDRIYIVIDEHWPVDTASRDSIINVPDTIKRE